MNAISVSARYDRLSILLHWLTALLVIALWALGESIDLFPKGAPRIGARSTHIACGALLGLVLLWRAWWRRSGGVHLQPADAGWMGAAATLTHRLLYVLLFATVLLGLTNAWVRGDQLFGLYKIPSFAPDDRGLRESIEDFHGFAANTLLIVAGLHAAAGLFHHLVLKDAVLRRMLPRRSANDDGELRA
ncbi:MAG: cytochrome b [Proteobacteria bacterium]|nr:cytochrome b [Pseudomonadota bacterium]